jgi:hypothetical protein
VLREVVPQVQLDVKGTHTSVCNIVEGVEGAWLPGGLAELVAVVPGAGSDLERVTGFVEPDEQAVATTRVSTKHRNLPELMAAEYRRLHPVCVCVRFFTVEVDP